MHHIFFIYKIEQGSMSSKNFRNTTETFNEDTCSVGVVCEDTGVRVRAGKRKTGLKSPVTAVLHTEERQ